ncbi:PAS domain S-box protein [Geomonas sp. Red32]|uniref:hybrid sensor histidine kinase/response regulator n=1 Tax=Geomonas sp. Red32 TaxID=2912856 RepID=UPI00202CE394|nr:PAS domain-containing sensor histidine kinase [Geomonas sp. Red32]MCM0081407.1 PAS domain S-box protein [Geomonas sp. Red32]
MTITRSNLRLSSELTVLVALVVALAISCGYFAISYQYTLGTLDAEAEITAPIVSGIVQANPVFWKYEHDRLEALLLRRQTSSDETVERRILELDGSEVASNNIVVQRPIIKRRQPLWDSGRKVAYIEITRSMRPILQRTAVTGLVGLFFSLLAFVLLPFRAIALANVKLRDSHDFLARVMESSTNAIVAVDLGGVIRMVNGRCYEMSGYSCDELYGARLDSLFPVDAGREVQGELDRLIGDQTRMAKFETLLLKKDASTLPIACGAAPILQNSMIAGTVLCIEDIAERTTAVEQLRHAKRYTEKLIQSANVIIVGLDTEGVVTLMNRTAEEALGYQAEELTGRSWFDLVMTGDAFEEMCIVPGESLEMRSTCENQIVTRSGALRTISWRNSSILEEDAVVGTLCFGIDVTEHRRTEALLAQSQKMESVGQLAGGVAHDFNNMLSVILGYAQICQVEVSPDNPLSQYIQEITRAGERSKEIVRQLLAFSRKEIVSPREVNLNAHYLETEKTLSRLLGEQVLLSFRPTQGLWPVRIDPCQADQILINLAVNARDAMPQGGSLVIRTENITVDREFCDYRLDASPGDFVCLTVTDTGVGMDQDLIKRIFEPFFTTKEVGKGTGLGLATVYGIVTQNHGFIDVESEPGNGTAFRIYLPRWIVKKQQESVDPPRIPAGSGRVLVVEDDSDVRSMTTAMLKKMGYSVLQAETPEGALELFDSHGDGIDLVLSDVVMPGMNGREMAQRMVGRRPETKVLFMSGYSTELVAKEGVLENGMFYIQKPFNMEGLHTKIVEVRES